MTKPENSLTRLIALFSAINLKLVPPFRLLAWVFLALMMLFIVLQVFCRYVLNSSLFWPEDVSLMMMIWVAFAVAPIAYRSGANVSLDMINRLLGGRAFFLLQLLIHVLVLLMLLMLINEAINIVGRSKIRANSIPVPMKYIYLIMPIGFGAMILVGIELALRSILGLLSPDHPSARIPSSADKAESADAAVPQA